MGRLLALAAALIAGALIAWASQRPPAPARLDAPPSQFSAARALTDVRVMATRPHPLGSPANQEVRDHLLRRLMALGLDPQVRAAAAFNYRPSRTGLTVFGGQVETVVGVLPGRDRTVPAVALMAHYDSVPGSPGAADDAAGVASILEIVRALKAQGPPARDVLVVLTDGEEAGLLGAKAFFRDDPLARRIGLVLNLEARGGGGRAQMFETSARNAGLIDLFRRTAVRPSSSSLTVFVYRLTPNDTDLSEARAAHVPGLNYAFLGRQFDYHSPTATPPTLETGSLQDIGQQVLATAGAAAFAATLPAPGPEPIYSQLFGNLVIVYPPPIGWALLAGAAALLAWACARARRVEPLPPWEIVRGAGAVLAMTATAAAVLYAARLGTGAAFGYLEQRVLLAQAPRWELAVVLIGLGVLLTAAGELARGRRRFALLPAAAGLSTLAFGVDPMGLGLGAGGAVFALLAYGRPMGRAAAWAGVLLMGLVLGVFLMIAAPAGSYLIAWPLLLAAAAAAASALSVRRDALRLALLAGAAAVGLGWLGGLAHLMFIALDQPAALAAPLLAAALLVWPLAQPTEGAPPERLLGPGLLLAGALALLAVRFDPPYDARHPQATCLAYHLDQQSGRAWRVSVMPQPSAWTDAVLGPGRAPYAHWAFRGKAQAAPAPMLAEPAPDITLARLADGRLRLQAAAPPGARVLVLRLRPQAAMRLVSIAGLPADLALQAGRPARLHWEAARPVLDLMLLPAGAGTLQVDYAVTFERWPPAAQALPPRPANLMAWDASDATIVTGTRGFAW